MSRSLRVESIQPNARMAALTSRHGYIVDIYSYLSGNGEFFVDTLPFGFLPMYKGQR